MSTTAEGQSDRLERLVDLLRRLQRAAAADESRRAAAELLLATAALEDLRVRRDAPDRPPQIALLGPTQVGKSTVTNLLLGHVAAEVSPLAGFTVHPQAFRVGPVEPPDWIERYLSDWERVAPGQLDRERTDQYTCTDLVSPDPLLAGPHAIWDTPDFDSLRAGSYLAGVFRIAALADVLVVVLSREKYSDLAVWDTLETLAPLRRQVVFCLNKTDADVADELSTALRARLREYTPEDGDATIARLPVAADLGTRAREGWPAEVSALREQVAEAAARPARVERAGAARDLVRRHWDAWLGPVRAEHAAAERWRTCVRVALDEAEETYRRDYLEHPQRFDTFHRAIAELLTLLEIPGVAATLSRVRNAMTWPARQLFRGRSWWRSENRAHSDGSETLVLRDVLDRLLLHVQRETGRNLGSPEAAAWWTALHERLHAREDELRERVETALAGYRERFAARIQEAARDLYAALQERPALLNTLRGMRVTADALVVAVAFKTAGLGVDGLLLAPAMVMVTSTLTEGALGTYMQTVSRRLRDEQLAALRREVLTPTLAEPLTGLASELCGPGIYAIAPEEIDDGHRWLTGDEHA